MKIKLIHDIVSKVVGSYNTDPVDFEISTPKLQYADYSCNVAMVLARKLQEDSFSLAERIAGDMKAEFPENLLKEITVVRPGFINMTLKDDYFVDLLYEINDLKMEFGQIENADNRTFVVEYSSPNIAKSFTIGHLRSTIIGDSIANILEHLGYNVVRDNHIGDWGTQFGKMIYAILKWGDIEEIGNSDNTIRQLVELYQRFHAEAEHNEAMNDEARLWFVKLEQGDETARDIWQKCIDWSMQEFDKIYGRLGVSFDTTWGESFFQDKMDIVLQELQDKNLVRESDGALLVFFPEESKMEPLMVQKSDGSTLYATRDLATDRYRKEVYGDDVVIINEVGIDQQHYFQQIFATEELLGYFTKGQRVHIKHGMYRFPEGKMSTRKGNVIWLSDVLDQATEAAEKLVDPDNAEIIAIAAIKFNDLVRAPEKGINFSWESILNTKGNTGPYLQYTVVRIRSLVQKADSAGIQLPDDLGTTVLSKDELQLARLLERFTVTLGTSAELYSPHYLAIYLLDVARELNGFYGQVNVLQTRSETALLVMQSAADVIELGLSLLGINVPEKM